MSLEKIKRLTKLWNEKHPERSGRIVYVEPSRFHPQTEQCSAYWSHAFIVVYKPKHLIGYRKYMIPVAGDFADVEAFLDWAIDRFTLTDLEMVRKYAVRS